MTSKSLSRDGIVESYGLESEVLCVSKLGCSRIIPTGEKKSASNARGWVGEPNPALRLNERHTDLEVWVEGSERSE